MMLGAIFAGYIILHQQVTAKPWNYPPGFVSDFHENIHNMVSETGHRDRQAQSRSGVAQLSQGYAKTEIDKLLTDKTNAMQIISGLFNPLQSAAKKELSNSSTHHHRTSAATPAYSPPPQENSLNTIRENIKSAIASTISGAEEVLLNAKYVMNIPEAPEIDTDFGQLLRKKKTQFKELLTMENLMGLMGQVGELYGERGTLNIPYNLRRLVKTYQGNFKHSNTRLKKLQVNVNDILDGLRPSDTPTAPPPTYLTKDPFPVANLLPLDPQSPLSPRDQIMLQYASIIIGGALILAV